MTKKSQSAEALLERLSKLSNGLVATGEVISAPVYPAIKIQGGTDGA
jgi:hypothetical protein